MVVNIAQESHERSKCVQRNVAQLTEDGLIGLNGRLVVNPAELVIENVPEAVRDQHRVLAENLAQEKRGKLTSVTPIHALSMEAGLVGAHGQLAADPVNPGHKFDHGAARSHRLKMAGKHVQGWHENSECATRIHVRFTVVGRTGLCQHHAVSLVAVD